MSEMTTTIVANACNKCGLAIEPLSADPGLWAVWICLTGDNGENKPYHNKCILGPIDELDCLRQENERLKGEVEELKSKLKDAYLPSSAHIQDIYELTSHKQALEVARVALQSVPPHRTIHGEAKAQIWSDAITTINNVLKEGE